MNDADRRSTPAAEGLHPGRPVRRIGYVLKVFPRVSETFVINEIRALEERGEDLRIYSLHPPQAAVPHRILRELRSPVVYIEDDLPAYEDVAQPRRCLERDLAVAPDLCPRLLPRKYVRLAAALAARVRADAVDHLHAHFASRSGHVAALAAALSGRPYSLTAHAKDIYHCEVDQDLLRWKIAQARFVVTVTDYNRHHLQRLVASIPGAAEKIVRIYNGIDLDRFRPADGCVAPPLVLGVGRLVEKKGFTVLVEACRLLRERGYDFRCEIIGDGSEGPALRQQIESGRLEGIVALRGVLSTEQVAEALRAATVVALPALVARDGNVDALPTVLLEAMATERPVVSTSISGIPEIVVDGETGLLAPPGDPPALAAALAALIDQPARAAEMGRAGRRRAERLFDLRTNVAELRGLLHGAVNRVAS